MTVFTPSRTRSHRTGRRAIATLMCSLGLLGTAACTADSSSPEAVEAPVEGVRVQLLEPGNSPRATLAYRIGEEEASQELTYSATQGLEQKTAHGEGEDVPYGDVTMDLPLNATASEEGEEIATTVVVGRPDGTNAELNEDMASAEGFEMHQTMEPSGRVKTRSFGAPEGATDGARASVEQALTQMTDLPIVFPEEEVGPGAKWTVSGRVDEGVSLRQELTYTLVERDGDKVVLDVAAKRRPAVASLADTDLKVLEADSTSEGRITVNLSRPLPAEGKVSVETTVTYGKDDAPLRVLQTITSRSEWK